MIQFFLGSNTKDLSDMVQNKVLSEASEHSDRTCILIVPEQFTLQTQRDLVAKSSGGCVMDVDILSFNRLAFRVFKELGLPTRPILEDTGKNLILKKIAIDNAEKLKFLRNGINRMGYISEVRSVISELSQYCYKPSDLSAIRAIPGMGPMFDAKLSDIELLYEEFTRFVEESSEAITAEMVLEELCNRVDSSNILANSLIVFDGFTGFTPTQMAVIEKLIGVCGDIIITGVLPPEEWESVRHTASVKDVSDSDLFAMTKTMVVAIRNMAASFGKSMAEPIFSDAPLNEPRDKYIYELENPILECEYVSAKVKSLVMDGYRYKDIAIICADPKEYAPFLKSSLLENNIPHFFDLNETLDRHPAIETVLSVLDVVSNDYAYSDIIRLLKCGFIDIDDEEIDRLDFYLLASGIKGRSRWSRAFAKIPRGYEALSVAALNETRDAVFKLLKGFESKETKIKEHISALKGFLNEIHFKQKLILRKEENIYNVIINIIDKMEALLGDADADMESFKEILASGIEGTSVGRLPSAIDCVSIGDVERTRLDDIKILFMMGVNEGRIPKNSSPGGLLTQSERTNMAKADFGLSPTIRQRAFIQRFYLHMLFAKPSDVLILSYFKSDFESEESKPSYVISRFNKSDNVPIIAIDALDDIFISSDSSGWRYLMGLLREYVSGSELSDELKSKMQSLLKYYYAKDKVKIEASLEDIIFKYNKEPIKKAILRTLDKGNLNISVSRLEKYAECAYAYFLRYILSLNDRYEHALDSIDMGNLYHSGLENYSMMISDAGIKWSEIEDDASDNILNEAILKALDELEQTSVYEKEREKFIISNMKDTLRTTVSAIRTQVKAGRFEPKGFEVSLSSLDAKELFDYELEDDVWLRLNGKIDRFDTYENEGKIYVKIVDYKSSKRGLDINRMNHGLQIQLIFYMDAVCKSLEKANPDKEIVPAGALYMHVNNPLVDVAINETRERIETEVLKGLKPAGVIAGEMEVLKALDENLSNGERSVVAPFNIKKDGDIGSSDSVVSLEDMKGYIDTVRDLIRSTSKLASDGNIDISPYWESKDKNGCTYCEYHSVCGFERDLDGFEFREIK